VFSPYLMNLIGSRVKLKNPLYVYNHDLQGGNAIIGGVVYYGKEAPNMNGLYFFGDLNFPVMNPAAREIGGAPIFTLERFSNGVRVNELHRVPVDGFIQSFGVDHDGELYVLTKNSKTLTGTTGKIHRLHL